MTALPEEAGAIATAICAGRACAGDMVARSLSRIAARDEALNCFTLVRESARNEAAALDAAIARGAPDLPLAGVPFAVKNLFDIAGQTTIAGSIIDAENPPAERDAVAISRLKAAGAILVGALNMDEYAYGFTTENVHYGLTRNPHDPSRLAGGSSGGSAAAVAAGMVPVSLGSDTNGSVRVPAAFCGVYGLKPTFGAISRRGVRPFVHSLDHVGLFARTAADVALVYNSLRGHDPEDPASNDRAAQPIAALLPSASANVRAARLTGWFASGLDTRVANAVDVVSETLRADPVHLPGAPAARSAAFCITAAEGGALHLNALRARPNDFDPATRDRLIAGAMLPAHIILRAQRYRRFFLDQTLALLARYDVLIAPATPFPAPKIGQASVSVDGVDLPVRANAGMFAQPFSFIGLPALTLPLVRDGALPVGVQVIASPWREDLLLHVAMHLERAGVVTAGPIPVQMDHAA